MENAGQERWLQRKLTHAGITGIRMFDADGLREELARRAGIEPLPPPAARAALAAFAVKVAAQDPETTRNATPLAEACDTLARAGWHLNQLTIDTPVARRLHRTLAGTPILPGTFDRQLHSSHDSHPSHPPLPARLCCIGWDATHWPDLALLHLAATAAAHFEMYVPSPRLPADARQRGWIEALEQRLALERATCPESGFASENEPLVARLENSQLASRSEAHPPILHVGREWPDQVRLVCRQVESWLAENPTPGAPIGIIAPEDSPTAVAVAEVLEKAGIQVEHPGRKREPNPTSLIIEQIARYHLNDRDVADLLELARLLWLHARASWNALDPEPVQDLLDRAFQVAQSRKSRILAQALPSQQSGTWAAICKLVETLGHWEPSPQPWPAVLEKWAATLSALRLPGNANLPIGLPPGDANLRGAGGEERLSEGGRARIGLPLLSHLFQNTPIPASAFLEWLADTITAERLSIAPIFPPLAPVVITTPTQAAQQTWEHLIFLDSNEHIWPAPIAENPFLPDATRARLNRNPNAGALLLTTRDLRALDQARFLDLIEHCRRPIAFAGVLLEHTDTGDHVQPNEWVLRALLETADDEDAYPPDLWTASAQAFPPDTPPPLDPQERAHLELVHRSRQNPAMPFDRYQFNFHETRLEPGFWSATNLDEAVTCPATFALRTLFGTQSTVDWTPTRSEATAVGNRTHRWLGRILGTAGHLSPASPSPDDEAAIAQQMTDALFQLREWYTAEGLALPLWWETCLRKTAWATRRCLREARKYLNADHTHIPPILPVPPGKPPTPLYCATEQKLTVSVRTPSGPLPLKGRIDILISDRPDLDQAHVRIFDFKTGRGQTPTLGAIERGYGAQFAAYYLMARDSGAAEAVIGIIKPEARAQDLFSKADETSLRARFAVLAELRRSLRFGRRGPLVSDYGVCETLPLGTVPIDPAILDQKAGLFLLAS
jgi:hypothetical protein